MCNAEQKISNFQLKFKLDFHSFSNTQWENLFMYLTKQQTIKCFHFFIHSTMHYLQTYVSLTKHCRIKSYHFFSSIHSTIHYLWGKKIFLNLCISTIYWLLILAKVQGGERDSRVRFDRDFMA